MDEFRKQLNAFRNSINIGISIKALIGAVLLFISGVHVYYILWKLLSAQSIALLYANIGIRTAIALCLLYLVLMAYRNLWSNEQVARFLDYQHGKQDDLYQNTYELVSQKGQTPVTESLTAFATNRMNTTSHTAPGIFNKAQFFTICFLFFGILSYWGLTYSEFYNAFRQFYTNKAAQIVYKDTITLNPGNVTIGTKESLLIKVTDPDVHLKHRLFYRYGTAWRELGLSNNSYLFNILDTSLEYYVSNEVTKSQVYKITVLDDPIVKKWSVSYNYPKYTALPAYTDTLSYGNIEAYKHSIVTLSILSNIPLKRASMIFEDASKIDLKEVAINNFITQITALKDQAWYLEMEDMLGRKSRPEEKHVKLIPDSPPQVKILFPNQDIVLNQNLLLPLILSADDDFGLANLVLAYQVNNNKTGSLVIQSVIRGKLFNTDYLWDMKNLELFPGDIVTYWAEIFDNAPSPQKAVSTKYRARFPSIEEIYAEIESQEKIKKNELTSALDDTQKLQDKLEEKRRELLKDPNLKWEDKKQLTDILEKQKDLSAQVDNIADNYQDLINKMQANSTLSEETLQKMMKIQELMQEIANDDLMKAMKNLEQAMQNINPDTLKKAMEDFKFSLEDFAKKIEQTLQLLESIKLEQALQKSLQMSEELEKLQKSLQEKTQDSSMDNQKLASDQAQLEDMYQSLQDELEKLKNMMNRPQDANLKKQLDELMKDMKQSSTQKDMQSSQKALKQNQRSEAQQSQSSALEKLRKFTMKLSEMKESMGSGNMQGMKKSIETAIRELLIFSKKHEATKAKYESNPYLIIPELIAAYEGIQISLNKLFSMPQVTLIIPPKFYIDLTETNKGYRDIFGTLNQSINPRINNELSVIQKGLNLMVYDLMQALQNSSSGSGGGGGMQSMMQMLEQMGQEQMAMNMLTEQLMMQMQAQGGKMDASMQQQFGKLANDQERLAENLKRALQNNPEAQKQGNAIKQIIDEAEAVARQIRQNQYSPDLMKRQENILSRLLDAQRSINKREKSEKRQAESSSGLSTSKPSTIDYETLRRATILEEGFKSYPKEYQSLIMEYLKILQEKVTK